MEDENEFGPAGLLGGEQGPPRRSSQGAGVLNSGQLIILGFWSNAFTWSQVQ